MHKSILHTIIIDCDNFEVGVEFWKAALGVTESRTYGDNYVFFKDIPGGFHIAIQKVPEPKTSKSRIHVDFITDDLEAEVQRLEKLGAKRTAKQEAWWNMQDPCGNEFCVVATNRASDLEQARAWE